MREENIKEKIDSHSSAVTNLRIGKLKEAVASQAHIALSNAGSREVALEYWAAVAALYAEVLFLFQTKATSDYRERAENVLKVGFKLHFAMIEGRKRVTVHDTMRLIWTAYSLNYLITAAGQVLSYWTRLSKVQPQGMDEILAHLEEIAPNIGKPPEIGK